MTSRKRQKLSRSCFGEESKPEPFEKLPDDLVICILSKLCSTSSSPSDFINALLVCKRFNRLGLNQLVLSKACSKVFAIRAQNWSESAHRFLKLCVNAGSVEACYFLGMIRFYCLKNRGSGASLMAKAAIKSHAPALYSLAVIQFNGSGGGKSDKDLRAGVALCARAAYLGHVGALRELGHCLKDGYGVKQNVTEGRRLLIQANARELATVLPSVTLSSLSSLLPTTTKTTPFPSSLTRSRPKRLMGLFGSGCCALLSDFGCNVPDPEPDPANRFLTEWFGSRAGELGPGLRLCSSPGCGRPETRPYEFRRCSACGTVNYCSRGCQAQDWKGEHKGQCSPQLAALNMGPAFGADVLPHGLVVDVEAADHHHHQQQEGSL